VFDSHSFFPSLKIETSAERRVLHNSIHCWKIKRITVKDDDKNTFNKVTSSVYPCLYSRVEAKTHFSILAKSRQKLSKISPTSVATPPPPHLQRTCFRGKISDRFVFAEFYSELSLISEILSEIER
jgi:hypothetical protein